MHKGGGYQKCQISNCQKKKKKPKRIQDLHLGLFWGSSDKCFFFFFFLFFLSFFFFLQLCSTRVACRKVMALFGLAMPMSTNEQWPKCKAFEDVEANRCASVRLLLASKPWLVLPSLSKPSCTASHCILGMLKGSKIRAGPPAVVWSHIRFFFFFHTFSAEHKHRPPRLPPPLLHTIPLQRTWQLCSSNNNSNSSNRCANASKTATGGVCHFLHMKWWSFSFDFIQK